MLSPTEAKNFIHALIQINTFGANPDTLDIPYDPECPIKKGSKIIKTKMDPGGDGHITGSTGVTIGGIVMPEGDAYIVKWDNSQYKHINGHVTFVTGKKISDKL